MPRMAFFCLITVMVLFVRSTTADEKKAPPKTLAEEANLLGDKDGNWISEGTVDALIKKAEKVNLTFRFEPEKGKPSGKAALGQALLKKGTYVQAELNDYKFELIENDGKRAIKLTPPGAKEPLILNYSLVGDKLTIHIPLGLWDGTTVPMQFKRGTGIQDTFK
jgi:hypothetical protein